MFAAESLELSHEPVSATVEDWPQVNPQHAAGSRCGIVNAWTEGPRPINARQGGCRRKALGAMHRSSDEWRCGRHLVTSKSRAETYERVCRPSVVRFDAAGLWPTALERESCGATQTNGPGFGRFLLCLMAISSKHAPRDVKPRGEVAIDRHVR